MDALGPALIRTAHTREAGLLTALALRSKAHWGYSAAFLEACRNELTVTPAMLTAAQAFVYEAGGRILGFYILSPEHPTTELEFFFVEPAAIGQGVGKALFRHMLGEAQRQGCDTVYIESDPYAEGFYRALGANRVGQAPSVSIPGRLLPALEVRVNEHPATNPWAPNP